MIHYVFTRNCRRKNRFVTNICGFTFFNISTVYAAILGFLGIAISFYDILQVIYAGPRLPCNLKTPLKSTKLVRPEVERDLKLISLVLSLEYYLLLIVGSVAKNGIFFLPWMIFYSIVIGLEFILFMSKSISDGLVLKKNSLIISMFVIYNWLAIFCAFLHINEGGC